MISSQDYKNLKFETLKHFWGYDFFRDGQEQIIDSLLNGKDTLVLLPTGGGKSLCYQLPALISEGTCLVISPLLALMKDQVAQLKNNLIEAEYLSSELDDFEAESILARCREGVTKILYVSPERLSNSFFLENIQDIRISFIAVDEAHCISEWGQDFRPSYQNIKIFREQQISAPCIALTATATPKVLEEIKNKLKLKNPTVFQQSFRRSNIRIITEEVSDKYQRILDLLRYNQSSGIIYTRTRKEAEELTRYLKNNKIESVDFFHAGLTPKEKNIRQKEWVSSSKNVLISTNAFGMGIDKDNVRFVIHLSPSASIENYYQEIGRGGRDGQQSFAFLIWNKQELENFDNILKHQIPNKIEFSTIITHLYSMFQVAENDLPEEVFQMHIHRLKSSTRCSEAKIKNVLNFLHNQEIIYLNNFKSLSSLELKLKPEEIDLLHKKDAYIVELLLRNLSGISAHKVMFSEQNLANRLGVDVLLIRERLRELQRNNYLEYIDGTLSSIKFLKHRYDRNIAGKYWNLFEHIQKNKILKWEEMKFYVQNQDHCKMKMILSYFGEKTVKNCENCCVCNKKKESVFGTNLTAEILKILAQKPATAEEIAIRMNLNSKESVLENLILLLDCGKVKMLNFRTYTLA